MANSLVINWNARTLRYVHTDADRQGRLRLVDAGQDELPIEGETHAAVVTGVQELVKRLKADKSRILILINRGSVDSATLTAPPATESELPALVQNMAVRDIPGATEQTPLDFIAFPPRADGTRTIRAMALVAEDHLLVRQLIQQVGTRSPRILVNTHPLRAYVPVEIQNEQNTGGDSEVATLVVSRGDDVADVLLCVGGLPFLSRTIRLAADVPQAEINRYLQAETQRTLISAGGQMAQPPKISHVVIVGNEQQTEGLDNTLSEHFQVGAVVVRPTSLLYEPDFSNPLVNVVNSGGFSPLLGAAFEDAASIAPAIDFANPRRPPLAVNRTKQYLAIAAAALTVVGVGYYYVQSQFDELEDATTTLVTRLNELDEIVKETQGKRQLAATLAVWEKNRISWPDELRDLTERIPARPNLTVQQLTISSAGPGTAVATFRGVSKQPEVIAQMESNLRDKYHDIRVPGVREQQEGNKVVSSFQATLTIRKRPVSLYKAAPSDDLATQAADSPVDSATESEPETPKVSQDAGKVVSQP
jgi:Tfp pilus assembly PilM family ATPase